MRVSVGMNKSGSARPSSWGSPCLPYVPLGLTLTLLSSCWVSSKVKLWECCRETQGAQLHRQVGPVLLESEQQVCFLPLKQQPSL